VTGQHVRRRSWVQSAGAALVVTLGTVTLGTLTLGTAAAGSAAAADVRSGYRAAPTSTPSPSASATAVAAVPLGSGTSGPATPKGLDAKAIPILAYYYIWFDPSSWDRAKKDQPQLGRYSSDERAVMRRHIELARSAGIDGFLVSWKDTPKLTERLHRLAEIAREENFSLGIVYQGLDFAREPIPVSKVAADLKFVADTYADDPVFHVLGPRPLVVWTGTDAFSDAELRSAVDPVKDRLMMLASSRSVGQWQRVAGIFEGNAYYWSSVNPAKSWYPRELAEMGAAVHATGDLWVAPAAAGFDATLVGGRSVVGRDDGRTLQAELAAAVRSAADLIGLISWNEFTENSHVEPSHLYGNVSLTVLAAFTGSGTPLPVLDSSAPAGQSLGGGLNGIAAMTVMIGILGGLLVWSRWRRSTDVTDPPAPDEPQDHVGRHAIDAS
jgi:hypothetical protein